MYSKKLSAWESPDCEESLLLWCREPFNRENPEAMFTLANYLLAQASSGSQTAEAVYLMEQAAKLDYAQAALAMGQMFQYGWAVHRSRKRAYPWYERAAALGSAEAAALMEAFRRAKKRRTVAIAAVCCAAVLLCVGIPLLLAQMRGPQGVLVAPETELLTPATAEEFNEALSDLIAQYDNELVISGQLSTNRLLLMFEGEGIDLSRFPAATVIADEDNYLVIQFASEADAQACLEALRQNSSVLFADMDEYRTNIDAIAQPNLHSSALPYRSPYSGETYYTWGAEFLGLDRMAAWLKTRRTQPVVVAVLDTGVEPCDETRARILSGADMAGIDSNGWADDNSHGTHVASTILDCTQGLNVSVLPVRVFLPGERTSAPDSYLVQGLRFAMDKDADVINMSLGGPCTISSPSEDCGGSMDYIIRQAVEQGIVVVVAAGNGDDYGNPVNTNGECPAHIGECIVVAACDRYQDLGYFSNYGDSVDVCAPGVEIDSYVPGGYRDVKDGTSMAAPHIAALAAMMKLYLPDKTPAQIERYISEYCVDMGNEAYYGEGIPWAGYLSGD